MRRFLLALVPPLAVACQRYDPAPLDLPGHWRSAVGRDVAGGEVAAYARALAARAGQGEADAYNPSDGLSLREAEAVALFFNPQLRAARLKARVAAVGAAEAGRWADPVLRVDAERIVRSVPDRWVVGGLLDLTVPLSGRLTLERDRAAAEADVAAANVLLDEQRVLAELAAAWAELAVLDGRIELTRSFLQDLDVVVGQAEKLRAAGELGPLEAGLFRVERVRRDAERQSLGPQRQEQELTIKALMGLTPEAPVRLVPSLPPPVDPAAAADRRRAVEQWHPRVRLARAEHETAERALAVEVRRQFPDLTVGGGFGTDEGADRILGGLSIPIPLFNGNRRAIAEARANRDAARAAAEAAYEGVVSALARAEAAVATARVRREVLEREVAPLADGQLRVARDLGRLGAAGTLVVFEALTRAHEIRIELLEATGREAAAHNQVHALVRPAAGAGSGEKERP